MKKPMHQRPLNMPSLLVKDALRGLRFAVRKGGQVLSSNTNSALPKPMSDLPASLFRGADEITLEMEARSCGVLGGPFQKNSMPDTSFFGPDGFSVANANIEASAGVLYFGLSYSVKKLGKDNPLLSEFLCATCLQLLLDDIANHDEKSGAEQAATLFSLLMNQKVFRNISAPVFGASPDGPKITVAASFAASLWFFLPRGSANTTESELLDTCCEIAESDRDKIFDKKLDNDAMSSLFQYYLNIV